MVDILCSLYIRTYDRNIKVCVLQDRAAKFGSKENYMVFSYFFSKDKIILERFICGYVSFFRKFNFLT